MREKRKWKCDKRRKEEREKELATRNRCDSSFLFASLSQTPVCWPLSSPLSSSPCPTWKWRERERKRAIEEAPSLIIDEHRFLLLSHPLTRSFCLFFTLHCATSHHRPTNQTTGHLCNCGVKNEKALFFVPLSPSYALKKALVVVVVMVMIVGGNILWVCTTTMCM